MDHGMQLCAAFIKRTSPLHMCNHHKSAVEPCGGGRLRFCHDVDLLFLSSPFVKSLWHGRGVQVQINQFSKGDSKSGLSTLTSLLLVGVDRREENSAYCTPRTRPQECCTQGFSQWQAINERRYNHICLHWRRCWNSCPGLERHLLLEFENLCHQAPHSTRNHRLQPCCFALWYSSSPISCFLSHCL